MKDGPVLLVEDNPDDAALALRGLKQGNLANPIIIVKDGVEALDYLFGRSEYQENSPPALPAVVLLDLKLPKLTGIEVLRQMRGNPRTKHVPVVVLTSSNEEQDLADCYEIGCNSYIRKPVDFKRFAEAVEHMKLYWLVLNEPPPQMPT